MTLEAEQLASSEPAAAAGTPEQIWAVAQEELRFQLARPSYETWLANAALLSSDSNHFTVAVPTILARNWVSERFLSVIQEVVSGVVGHDCTVDVVVDPSATPPDAPLPLSDPVDDDIATDVVGTDAGAFDFDTRLNPTFTFSTFVVGNSTHFANAACQAVAAAPGRAYNPLFLYGGVGLGKTHLMHAIGHAVKEGHRRSPKVAYITSEKFMNEMIAAIQENKTPEFRARYRSVDVLLIDDIQFLAGKDRTQEEFFHTFNALHGVQKQIVVTSDRPPREIPTLEDRLRSRFEGGLIADLQPPDFETRLAILKSKLDVNAELVPNDVLAYIAHRIHQNIRELEGALIRVLAHASIDGRPVQLDVAQQILRDIIPASNGKPLTIERIQRVVAEYYAISLEEMKGKRRDKNIVFPRQVAMYLIREDTDSSLPIVGASFGGRDHTTALHAIEKISELLKEDAQLKAEIAELRAQLQAETVEQ